MLLYVMRDDAQVRISDIEADPTNRVKLEALKTRILSDHTVYRFSDVEDLKRQIYEDLGKILDSVSLAAMA